MKVLVKCEFVFAVFAAILSSAYLLDNKIDEGLYNSVKVTAHVDPCDSREVPIPDFNAPGRRVSLVSIIYSNNPGQTVPSVIGGQAVAPGEYPHMAALGWKARVGTWIFKCGGSLISEKFVLTAAHCSSVPKKDTTVANVKPSIVRLGSKNILDTVDGKPVIDIEIKEFKAHHQYHPHKHYYDIALVELKEEAPFLCQVHPSCLWTKFDNPEKGTVTGWGVIETATYKTSPELQKAEIRIIDSDHCDETLYSRQNRKWRGIVRHQLCAGDVTGRVDTCRGDSGGPLQSKLVLKKPEYINISWNLHNVVGVISFGFGCARENTPGIYTRVSSFIGWIEGVVWPLNNVTNSFKYNKNQDRFIFRT